MRYLEASDRIEALLTCITLLKVQAQNESEELIEESITVIGNELDALRNGMPSDAQDLFVQVDALEQVFINVMNEVRP